MTGLADLPRLWPTIVIPGIGSGRATYSTVDLGAMPPVEATLDGSLEWLRDQRLRDPSLAATPDEPPEREADRDGLAGLACTAPLPRAFERFIVDPEARRRVPSATSCYLDLGTATVAVAGGGTLIHVLVDQQWVVHWLLYVGPGGSEAVVATPDPVGMAGGEDGLVEVLDLESRAGSMAVCADSFEEFLYRYWAMNELFFQLAVDRTVPAALPGPLRAYADRHPRTASARTIFG